MEYINIISQEAITQPLGWPTHLVGTIGLLFALSVFVILLIQPSRMFDIIENLFYHAVACIVLMLGTLIICSVFFPIETGRYKYEGTLDPDMTTVEFAEFQEAYTNITFKDGVWYFEDKEN